MLARLEALAARWLSSPPARWLAPALLLALYAAALAPGLADAPVARQAEERCRDVTASMVATGDWLVPYQQGQPRLHKPPLYYWAASAASVATGSTSRLALRLPAAAFALLLVLVTFFWGRSLGGPALGLLAGLLLVLTEQAHALGRRGVAEMPLALFCTLALFSFDAWLQDGQRRRLRWFGLWVGLACLAKASMAVLIIGLPVTLWLWRAGRLRLALRQGLLVWPALGLAACLAWYAAVLLKVPGGWETVLSEALLPLGVDAPAGHATAAHYRPPWFFVKAILPATFPAILLLPVALGRARRSRFWADQPRLRFLACVFLSVFVALSILPQKQRHYLLPLLPPLALLLASSLLDLRQRAPECFAVWLRRLGLGMFVLGSFLALLLAAFFELVLGAGSLSWGALALGGPGLCCAAWRAGRVGRARVFAVLATVALLSLSAIYFGQVSVWRDHWRRGSVTGLSPEQEARWHRAFESVPLLAGYFKPHPSLWTPPGP